MAQKVVKVKAHKRLDGNGKIESVDAHLRKISSDMQKLAQKNAAFLLYAKAKNGKPPTDAQIGSLANELAPKLQKLYGQ